MQIRIILIVVSISLFLVGCASYEYSRTSVQQGNLITQSSVDRLKIGMSKEDVAILMGTSLISPLFNNDRWDYAYTLQRVGKFEQMKTVSLRFVNQRLASIEQYPPKNSMNASVPKTSIKSQV